MSDKYTDVSLQHGSGLGLWGHVDPDEAIAETRRFAVAQRDEAVRMIEDIDAGKVEVHHQLGPWARRNRRKVR